MTRITDPDFLKSVFFWLLSSPQTVRSATEEVVIEEILAGDSYHMVADVGCGGGGYLLRLLAPRSQSAVGIEIDDYLVRLAARRLDKAATPSRLEVLQGSVDRIPLAAESLDLVLCTQVLEHVADVAGGIREIHRVLRPSGRAVLAIPIQPDPCFNEGHIHPDLSPDAFDAFVAANGFLIENRRTCTFLLSRAVIWLTGHLHVPLPLVPLCRLEQATSKFMRWPRPYTYICVAAKR